MSVCLSIRHTFSRLASGSMTPFLKDCHFVAKSTKSGGGGGGRGAPARSQNPHCVTYGIFWKSMR